MQAYIAEQGYSTVMELSRHFRVSDMTVRRDIARLAESGLVRSVHGGASSVSPTAFQGTDYQRRTATRGDVKRRVAEEALTYVEEGAVIAVDAGTSGEALAQVLPDGLRLKVVTPSLPVIAALVDRKAVEVVGLGGVLHPETLSFAGPMAVANLAEIQIDTLFLTVSSLSERGAFCTTDFDAVTKRALIESANRVIVLADSSKFSITAIAKICSWDRVDVLVIDDEVSDDWRRRLDHMGTAVRVVPATIPA